MARGSFGSQIDAEGDSLGERVGHVVRLALIGRQNGDQARFQGDGTINGSGTFGFMLTVVDAPDGDSFRIKIWTEDELDVETVIYDNRPGSDDTAYDGTAIGGGNITVHRK